VTHAVIHIGANKTGSTTLQRKLFPRAPGLLYLGEDCDRYQEHRETLDSLVWDDDLYYRRDAAVRLFEAYRREAGDRTFVYSNEDIMRSRVPAQCARRLKTLLPDAHVLLVVRNQLSAVQSWYASHGAYLRNVPRRYWRRYVSFDEWMDYCTMFPAYSPLAGFMYHEIAGLYAGLFGRDRVHILLYEDFVERPDRFIAQLCSVLRLDPQVAAALIAGARERPRNTRRRLRYHRFRSSFLWTVSLRSLIPGASTLARAWNAFLAAGPPVDDVLTPYWRDRIIALYADDNGRLARDFALPLASLGYPCERPDVVGSPDRLAATRPVAVP
jgi:sulfotransferase family protein